MNLPGRLASCDLNPLQREAGRPPLRGSLVSRIAVSVRIGRLTISRTAHGKHCSPALVQATAELARRPRGMRSRRFFTRGPLIAAQSLPTAPERTGAPRGCARARGREAHLLLFSQTPRMVHREILRLASWSEHS